MDAINFLYPINTQHTGTDLRTDIAQAIQQVWADQFQSQMQDLVDYGTPHLGSRTVVERFTKQDGLAVLRRPVTADVLMRIIYANWSSLASERGLGFLQFVLQMLWPDQWQVIRLWHSKLYVSQYPRFLFESSTASRFLTSRIRIYLDDTVPSGELSELAPILRRLVPANIVPQVVGKVTDVEDLVLRPVLSAVPYVVVDATPNIWDATI